MSRALLKPTYIYYTLLILRVCAALCGTGYIHPDEHFQNGEIIAGQILGLHTLRTWEWEPAFPIRSIIPPAVTTGVPCVVYSLLWGGSIAPSTLFRAERLSFLLLSSALDYSISKVIPHDRDRFYALILLASSHVVLTFQVRPFSNSIEAVFVALSMVVLHSLVSMRPSYKRARGTAELTRLGLILVFAFFTRITSVAFMLPVVFEAYKWTRRRTSTPRQAPLHDKSWWRLIRLPALVTSIFAAGFVLVDTLYFRGILSWPVLTPLNFWSYNSSPSSLEHGHHPAWLHVVVNLPMIVGPGMLIYGIIAARDLFKPQRHYSGAEGDVGAVMKRTSLYMIVTSLAILSALPHQEPRFLVPLVVPSIVLVVLDGRIQRAGNLFWVSWIITNLALVLLFGILHQGGVVPSLFHLHDVIGKLWASSQGDKIVKVFYWKTYMPPRHLLAIPESDVLSGKFTITDLSGAGAIVEQLMAVPSTATSFLVAPLHATRALTKKYPGCVMLKERVYPHLSLDHISETVEAGWKDGLSLGIYVVDAVCFRLHKTLSS